MEEAGRILIAVSDAATWVWAIWVAVAFVVGGPLFVRDEWRLRAAGSKAAPQGEGSVRDSVRRLPVGPSS